jgi:hypothetical protein
MSNEFSELKEHVRWLEGELGGLGHMERRAIDAVLKELVAGFNPIIRIINAAKQRQSGLPALPLFEQLSNGRPRPPKQRKFELKVVKNDQPDKPGAA